MDIHKTMKALLQMIEPHEDYKGGSVSYETAKEFYDAVLRRYEIYQDTLDRAVACMDDTSFCGTSKFVASDEYQKFLGLEPIDD